MALPGQKAAAADQPSVSAKGAVLMEASTGRILWEQNGEKGWLWPALPKL